jgi:ABC-type sugar transport system ATPase subunit
MTVAEHPRGETVLELEGVHKHFGGVVALDDVNLRLGKGEVLALAGDNGAGKSTLAKVITGVHQPSEGRLVVNGQERHFHSPKDALAAGISAVYQDLSLCENLSAAATLYLGNEPRRKGVAGKMGLLDIDRMHENARGALTELGIRTLPSTQTRVMYLSGGQRQAIAIVRATLEQANIVVLDEPTAALGIREREQVYRLIERLQDRGYGVIIISHSIPEIMRLSTRIMILRLGRVVETLETAELGPDAGDVIVSAITGAKVELGVAR